MRGKELGILLISNLFSVGPTYGSVCKELAQRLSDCGWQVITTSALKNRLLRPLDMLLTTWRMWRHYQIAHIDVFSGPAFRWAELTAWALRRLQKSYVLTLHGGNLPSFATEHPGRVRALLKSAAEVTTPSRYLLEKMSAYRADIDLIPNPIEIQLYPFRLRNKPKPHILYLRALHQMYNPTLAVHALVELLSTYPEATLSMVGPDKGDGTVEELCAIIEKQQLAKYVSLVGAVPKKQVPAVMQQADIFVNTTNVDNTPISVIEAMACGLCIVSTNAGGIPYLLAHEQDALLVSPNDPQAMADAIKRILTEPGLAERLSRNARAKAKQFDWSNVLPQWEKLLLDTISANHHD